MPKDPACGTGGAVSRRALLAAFPATATGAALGLPQPAQASTDTPIMRLYRQWEQARSDCNYAFDEECDRCVDLMGALEDQMLDLRCECIGDLAAKIAALTSWGDFGVIPDEVKLWEEIRALIANPQR